MCIRDRSSSSSKPKPSSQTGQTGPGNLIDLDAPEFDEFNLSEEDMAILMASFTDDRGSKTALTNPVPVTQTTPTTQQPKPPPPKPAPKPQSRTSQPRPPGLIDLNTPEFSEFDLSDADIEVGGGGGQVTNVTKEEEEDELAELSAWVTGASPQHQQSSQSTGYAPPTKKPSVDTGVIQDRLKMYNDALKEAESQKDTSKIRRYKRAIGTIEDMLKATRSGRPINMEELPPIVSVAPPTQPPVTVSQPLSQPPTTSTKPKPSSQTGQTGQTGPGNLIDLDAPEFDEFNLSEEDMAILMASFTDDRGSKTTPTNPVPVTQTTPTIQQPKPPPPKPAPKPQSRTSQPQPAHLV